MGLLVVFERERTKFHLAVATEFFSVTILLLEFKPRSIVHNDLFVWKTSLHRCNHVLCFIEVVIRRSAVLGVKRVVAVYRVLALVVVIDGVLVSLRVLVR